MYFSALGTLTPTGYADNAAVENGNVPVAARVLTKPFSLEALARAVAELLPSD